tara:strand:- start:1657 stop:1956 length:300 start_codon:yes stop_codon:yes gene_type:complete
MSTSKKIKKAAALSNRSPSQILIDDNAQLRKGMNSQSRLISELKKELESYKNNDQKFIVEYKERAINAENALLPLKESVNKLTSERSNWLRKLKRAGIK